MKDDIEIRVVDAFSAEAFAGNPAAVCLLDVARDARWMQLVAREMNLSETVFVTREEGRLRIRWFTPATEVVLCGHATVAAAHVLWETGALPADEDAVFDSLSGVVGARRVGDEVELDFPTYERVEGDLPDLIASAVAAPVTAAARFDRPNGGDEVWVLELESESAVREVAPRMDMLREPGTPNVIVTAAAEEDGTDFVSRYFAPSYGVDEDPVTGSSFCALGPYWAEKTGRTGFRAHQVSERGGRASVEVRGDRVGIAGRAVTVLEGRLRC